MQILKILTIYLVMAFHPLQAQVSCECEKIQCGSCEIEQGVDFYTAPCGDGGKRLKSCSRPRCEKLKTCGPSAAAPNVEDKKQAPVVLERVQLPVGTVVASSGEVYVHRLIGGVVKPIESVRAGFKVLEKDVLETRQGRLRVVFIDKNELALVANSRAEIARQQFQPELSKRNTVLNLVYGKLRSTVHQTYDGKENSYEVRTPTAVAGVRGTDFVTSYDKGENAVTQVQTLHGAVQLSALAGSQSMMVPAGQQASFIVPAKELEALGPDHGHFSALAPVSTESLKSIIEATSEKSAKAETTEIAKVAPQTEEPICSAPTANFNQCAWSCEGNRAKESKCRLESEKVQCVRRRCNLNGQWGEETRLPKKGAETYCTSPTVAVGTCDY